MCKDLKKKKTTKENNTMYNTIIYPISIKNINVIMK